MTNIKCQYKVKLGADMLTKSVLFFSMLYKKSKDMFCYMSNKNLAKHTTNITFFEQFE